jgi:hypothetical protein
MARVVTINRPDVVSLIETAAAKLTGGNKTEAVALALRKLLDSQARTGSLFGRHRGAFTIAEGVDLTEPTFNNEEFDAWTGREIDR